jgi:Ca2+-binding RTX toxin-like protein
MSAVLENVEIAQELFEGYFVFGTGLQGDANIDLPGSGSDVVFTSVFEASDDTIDVGAGDDLVSAGAGDDSIAAGDGNNVLSGGLGADTFIFEFFGDEQVNAIVDFSQAEGDEIHVIDEDGNELTISDLFFTENGIGDGAISVEFDDNGNLTIDGQEVEDDDFEIL